MHALKRMVRIGWRAYWRFANSDGWAIASHVALTGLMALFPFVIVITAIAGWLNLAYLSNVITDLLFEAWPQQIATPIAAQVRQVLTQPRSDYLTFGLLVALYLASNGAEAARIGLNRAYAVAETRHFLYLRFKSIGFVLVGVAAMMSLGLLVVLGPVIWGTLVSFVPILGDYTQKVEFLRWTITIAVLFTSLIAAHLWLPNGKRTLKIVLPGIVFTLAAWLTGAYAFAMYLKNFATYASTYAGLASLFSAIVFLYLIAAIFLFGAALNAEIAEDDLAVN